MPNHFSALGFLVKTSEDLSNLAMQAVRAGQEIEVPGQGSYIVWAPGEGIELWVQINQEGQIIGLNPHFKGEAIMPVGLTKRILRPKDTALDGAFYGWANAPEDDPEMGEYPLAFDVPDYRVYDALQLPKVANIQLAAFAREIKVYEKKEALQATGSRMAVESCIPSGTFRLQSQGGGPIDLPESEVIYHGRVLETAMLTNPFTHLSFHWTRIRTLGGEVDLVADPAIVKSTIVKDGVAGGLFWLSGRLR